MLCNFWVAFVQPALKRQKADPTAHRVGLAQPDRPLGQLKCHRSLLPIACHCHLSSRPVPPVTDRWLVQLIQWHVTHQVGPVWCWSCQNDSSATSVHGIQPSTSHPSVTGGTGRLDLMDGCCWRVCLTAPVPHGLIWWNVESDRRNSPSGRLVCCGL